MTCLDNPPTTTSPPDPWDAFGGLSNVEIFLGLVVLATMVLVCLCSCRRQAEDEVDLLSGDLRGEGNPGYEEPPPYRPPSPKAEGLPSYDEAVNME